MRRVVQICDPGHVAGAGFYPTPKVWRRLVSALETCAPNIKKNCITVYPTQNRSNGGRQPAHHVQSVPRTGIVVLVHWSGTSLNTSIIERTSDERMDSLEQGASNCCAIQHEFSPAAPPTYVQSMVRSVLRDKQSSQETHSFPGRYSSYDNGDLSGQCSQCNTELVHNIEIEGTTRQMMKMRGSLQNTGCHHIAMAAVLRFPLSESMVAVRNNIAMYEYVHPDQIYTPFMLCT